MANAMKAKLSHLFTMSLCSFTRPNLIFTDGEDYARPTEIRRIARGPIHNG